MRDLATASQLVKAASGKDKLESAWTIVSGNDYGQTYHQQADILQAMFNEGPFKFNTVGVDYNTYFIRYVSAAPNLTGGHEFDGAAMGAIAAVPEVDSFFSNHYISGGTFYKFEENYPADAKWDGYMKSQQQEQDHRKRVDIIQDFQRYAAERMYLIALPGQATTFSLAWPWAGNFGTFRTRGDTSVPQLNYWLDMSKMKA